MLRAAKAAYRYRGVISSSPEENAMQRLTATSMKQWPSGYGATFGRR